MDRVSTKNSRITLMQDHINQGSKHIWLPYTQMQNHLPQLEIEGAKGSKIFLKDGRVLIDGVASWWASAHGYLHPHIIKSLVRQAKTLPHIMLAGFAADETYKLAHRLAKFTGFDRVFFSDSGSTAIEVAMKISWQYFINKNQKNKTKFVSFKNSYHGDTTGAMSLADLSTSMHKKFSTLLLENFNLDLPKNQNDLNKFEDFIKNHKDEVAAIFIEPMIQCAGGMKFGDAEILRQIFEIAKKYEILFAADECAVGFYRLGKKFAFEFANIKPDILIIGKALTGGTLTLAATLTSEEIFASFLGNSIENALMHGPTFMGNPLAASAANASLDLFEQENYQEKVAICENFLCEKLKKFAKHKNVKEVRALGAVGVVETDFVFEDMLRLRKEFIQHGVFLRPFGGVIYLMPALNIKKNELTTIIKAIEEVL